jgi:hypothetical protein
MSRSGYSDELDQRELAMWRGRVASAIRGKRGQRLLRTLLRAIAVMPQKRLIREELVNKEGETCLLGAGGKAMGISDIDRIDPEDHRLLAEKFDVARCLIQEIEYVNDEDGWNETPEKRYERVRKWLVENVKPEAAI